MPVIVRKTTVSLQGICTVEDAEPLLQWLLAYPGGKVQMKECVNLHSAVLQTLRVGQAQRLGQPADANLQAWLDATLPQASEPSPRRHAPAPDLCDMGADAETDTDTDTEIDRLPT